MNSNTLLPAVLEFINTPKSHFIDGEYLLSQSPEILEVVNPHTEEVFAKLPLGDINDLNQAVESSFKAFQSWRDTAPATRQDLLFRFADKLAENRELLAQLEVLSTGKNINVARFEVDQSVAFTRYYAGWATKIAGETLTPSLPSRAGEKYTAMTVRTPIGVVGAIIPWNFPLMITIWKVAAALACGCTTVVKPSEYTPLTALLMAKLAIEAGIPKGVINIINGSGREIGSALIEHPLIAKVSFTGSAATGINIGTDALKADLTRFTLELGGKNPAVFCEDMAPQAVVDALIEGGLSHQGQICASIERAYIHESIIDEVIALFPAALKRLKIGEPFDQSAQFGPLANRAHFEKVLSFFEIAKKEEYEIIYGAKRVGDRGYYVEPTVVRAFDTQSTLMTEETFGPLLTLFSYKDDTALNAIINASPYGLTASVWTNDLSRALRLSHFIEAGTVWINMHLALDPSTPFGGVKASGIGREFGANFIDDYTDLKSIMIRY